MSSAYGKYDGQFNPAEQASHDTRRGSKKRILIIALSTVVLVAIVISIAVVVHKGRSESATNQSSVAANINSVCAVAQNPDACHATLSELSNGQPLSLPELFRLTTQLAMSEISNATLLFSKLQSSGKLDAFLEGAAEVCKELLGMSIEKLNDTQHSGVPITAATVEDFRTWLSAALTYQDTCLDGFENATSALKAEVAGYLMNSTEFSSNSLAIMAFVSQTIGSVMPHRRLLESDGFPSWMSAADRKLLQADPRTSANIVVAQDGSGQFTSISAALSSVKAGAGRIVIYVKKGVYKEIVTVAKGLSNVMIVGDGMDATVITGSKNAVDGVQTFKTATLSVFGKNFIGRDFAVQNSAGPAKHQAVAMISGSDQSAFYRMKFDAFQDTLYTHSMRQFYRECSIYGTVDFIFGNAAVVFQSCTILPRVPMSGQSCTITAQGKTDKNQNTGTSILSSTVMGFGNLAGVRVYLGRPWKVYATTVFIKTSLPAIIDPRGWMPWTGTSAPSTIFYAEYLNTGPGSDTTNRVKWAGVRTTLDPQTAASFSVNSFIGGGQWLTATGVPFVGTL